MFINQPNVTVKCTPSSNFLKDICKQPQVDVSAGYTFWEDSFKWNQIVELENQFQNH